VGATVYFVSALGLGATLLTLRREKRGSPWEQSGQPGSSVRWRRMRGINVIGLLPPANDETWA